MHVCVYVYVCIYIGICERICVCVDIIRKLCKVDRINTGEVSEDLLPEAIRKKAGGYYPPEVRSMK